MKLGPIIAGIILLIVIGLTIYFSTRSRENINDPSWNKLQSLIPEEAKECPRMQGWVKLTDYDYMKSEWRHVKQTLVDGSMPPSGYEHIWKDSTHKERLIQALENFGAQNK